MSSAHYGQHWILHQTARLYKARSSAWAHLHEKLQGILSFCRVDPLFDSQTSSLLLVIRRHHSPKRPSRASCMQKFRLLLNTLAWRQHKHESLSDPQERIITFVIQKHLTDMPRGLIGLYELIELHASKGVSVSNNINSTYLYMHTVMSSPSDKGDTILSDARMMKCLPCISTIPT